MSRIVTKNTANYWLLLLLPIGFVNYVWADNIQDQIVLLKSQDYFVRRHAEDALVKLGKPAVEALIVCLNDQNIDVRSSAADALGNLGDARAVEPLIVCLKDQEVGVRIATSTALGKMGKPALAPLIECLKDPQLDKRVDVREYTAQALVNLGKVAVEPLIACLQNQNWNVRSSAADALGDLGDTRAVEPLMVCLKEGGGQLVVYALGKLHDKRAVEPLTACLDGHGEGMRGYAAEALGSLGDGSAVPALVKALPDWQTKGELGASLKKLGWKPTSDFDLVYFWICDADGTNLKAHWEKTTRVLLVDVKSANQRKIENAVYTFVSLGNKDIVPKLIDALNSQGTKEMAETYLNCGNGDLASAAQSWATAHGYQISSVSGANRTIWGSW